MVLFAFVCLSQDAFVKGARALWLTQPSPSHSYSRSGRDWLARGIANVVPQKQNNDVVAQLPSRREQITEKGSRS
ncbi:hypothetical protein Micbo1qcDRAFT_157343, partial [Microdochium bolleyi]